VTHPLLACLPVGMQTTAIIANSTPPFLLSILSYISHCATLAFHYRSRRPSMSTFEYASKASPAIVYPSLVLVAFLQRNHVLKGLQIKSREGKHLSQDSAIQLTLDDGKVLRDFAIFRHFAKLASGITVSPALSIVRNVKSILVILRTNSHNVFVLA
jgi:hypothetical protein